MAPIRWYLMNYAEKKRVDALKKSSVKVSGNDVVASWKILIGLFLVPSIVNFTAILFFFFRSHVYATTFLGRYGVSMIFCILFSTYLVYCVQMLNGAKTNFRIVAVRLFVILYRNRIAKLRKSRKELKRQVKDVMDKYSELNQHATIKRRSLYVKSDPLDIDVEEIFGELQEIMIQ